MYRIALELKEPDRLLYLAIPENKYLDLFLEPIIQMLFERNQVRLLTFNKTPATIIRWIE